MKNDIEKATDIDSEMQINDILFKKLQIETAILEYIIKEKIDTKNKDFELWLDVSYFFRRVISILSNDDIPFRACVGLFIIPDTLPTLYSNKEKFIGDSDRDTDIFEFVIEYGYRHFDNMAEKGSGCVTKAFKKVAKDYIVIFEKDGEDDVER